VRMVSRDELLSAERPEQLLGFLIRLAGATLRFTPSTAKLRHINVGRCARRKIVIFLPCFLPVPGSLHALLQF
jgi:hypothetical protein